jgi:hypothetical protein
MMHLLIAIPVGSGGGAYTSVGNFEGSYFNNNMAIMGAAMAIHKEDGRSVHVQNCTFQQNIAESGIPLFLLFFSFFLYIIYYFLFNLLIYFPFL